MTKEEIGALLKKERESQGWSLTQLSQYSGVPISTLGAYERGEFEPKYTVLLKIAEGYKIKLSELIPESLQKTVK